MSGTFKRFEEIGTLVNFSKTVPLYSPLITQGNLPYESGIHYRVFLDRSDHRSASNNQIFDLNQNGN